MCTAAVGGNVLLLLPWLPSSGKSPSTNQQTDPVKQKDVELLKQCAAGATWRPQSHIQTSIIKRLRCNWEPEAKETASAEAFKVSECLSI